jgi:RNA polymerase sigma-70 factor (ECF subfamily)
METVGEIMSSRIDEDPGFCGNAIQRELHTAIQMLPEKQRLVFNMRNFDDMKYEDIAEITGTSVGALKASYHHAYNKIKETLLNL